MFENVTFKTDPFWRAKAEGLNQTQSVGTSIVIGSFLRFCIQLRQCDSFT